MTTLGGVKVMKQSNIILWYVKIWNKIPTLVSGYDQKSAFIFNLGQNPLILSKIVNSF